MGAIALRQCSKFNFQKLVKKMIRQFAPLLRPYACGVAHCAMLGLAAGTSLVHAHEQGIGILPEVTATSTREDLQGLADSAGEGIVTSKQLRTRPLLRAGDVMEAVPGLVATQHAGEGKANQYFLRGFNLDHGTDFATFIDGVPINMPTHTHGQGYTDLYFLIPELVDAVQYRKGPYYAEEGDFAAAGSARIRTIRRVDRAFGALEAGANGYRRALAVGSVPISGGDLLFAGERSTDNGPWSVAQNLSKTNLTGKYSLGSEANGWSLGVGHYEATWTSTDQVAQRAIDSGLIGRYGSLDPTAGGRTRRDAVNAQWAQTKGGEQMQVSAFALRYAFDLFSDFTYFSRGCDTAPVPAFCNGAVPLDQFQQTDRRTVYGLSGSRTSFFKIAGLDTHFRVGGDWRNDRIGTLGLYDTTARVQTNTVRQDSVRLNALGAWAEGELHVNEQWRAVLGLRWDQRRLDVQSSIAQNSGGRTASITSPKASLIYSQSPVLDLYANWGQGFHSNDARGTVARVDPRDPTQAVTPGAPLVKATGYEVGVRQKISKDAVVTASLWSLRLDSELVFQGDAGTTAPSRPSQRQGIELTTNWKPGSAWEIDADWSLSRQRYTDFDPAGDHIPNAMEQVLSLGSTYQRGPWTVGARLRYFGPRALIEDNSLRGTSSTLTNVKLAYRFSPQVEASVDVFNLFNRKANDIEYAYASRLPGEPAFNANTPNTLHVHPSGLRMLRLGLRASF